MKYWDLTNMLNEFLTEFGGLNGKKTYKYDYKYRNNYIKWFNLLLILNVYSFHEIVIDHLQNETPKKGQKTTNELKTTD